MAAAVQAYIAVQQICLSDMIAVESKTSRSRRRDAIASPAERFDRVAAGARA
jgi:hypothetical protein